MVFATSRMVFLIAQAYELVV